MLCYIALGLASAFGLLRRRSLMLWVFALLYLPCAVQAVFPSTLHRPSSELERILVVLFDPAGPNLALPFAAGVATQLLAGNRPVWSARWFRIAVLAFALSLPLGAVRVFCPLVLPYLLLSLGERLPFQKLERIGDFSYGIYIYAFVIQQCLTQFGVNRHGFPVFLAASIGLSMAAGAMSWFLIERPCIRLGQRLLSREKPRDVISSVSTLQPVAATIEV